MNSAILLPAATLVLWSLVMLLWLMVARLPAMKRAGIDLNAMVGGRGQQLDGVIPDRINWKAHNYAHLMEQPTIFYAAVFVIALTGGGDIAVNVWLAWGYVALRILHSIVQATFNRVAVRFALFALATLALAGLAVHGFAAALEHAG